ncbi:MAG: hypothetical protein AAF911_13505 [Planctomycetota bacterium]
MTESASAPASTAPAATTPADDNGSELPGRVPSRGWYGLAFVLMLIGVAAFIASVNVAQSQVDAAVGSMQRFVAPGSGELAFDQPGDYLVYYEKIGTFNGEDFDTTGVFRETPALDIDVEHQASGDFLTVRQAKYDKSESQIFNHGKANSEFIFTLPAEHFGPDAERPVRYTISGAHENLDLDDRVLLAVGPPVVGSLMSDWRGPFGGAAVLSFAFVISATTVLVTWMLRHGKVTRRQD